MADLTDLQAAGTTKVIGSDSTGLETNPLAIDSSGAITVQPGNTANTTAWLVNATSAGPVTPGTVASKSDLMGGQFNTSLPTLTTGQQAALQVDSSGRLLTSGVAAAATDTTATGTLGALNAAVQIAMAGQPGVGFQLAAGTLIGTLVTELSFDGGTTWVGSNFDDANTNIKSTTVVFASANTATAKTIVTSGGTTHARVRVSAYTSGTANITIKATSARDPSTLTNTPFGGVLPPTLSVQGGSVTTAAPTYTTATANALSLTTAGALRVDGSAVTQPISAAALPLPTGAATQTTLASILTNTPALGQTTMAASSPVVIASNQSAIPVSGTVTANIGTTNGLALDATLAKLTIAQGTALGANTQAMVGGSVTTAAPTYTTGNINPLSLTTAGALRVDGSGVTQPISATALPLPAGAATAANQTTLGSQTTKINDGTNTAAVKAASTAPLATDPALVVTISPNSNISVNTTNTTATATMAALNAVAGPFNTDGQGSIGGIITGTWVGTITAQGTVDGTNWVNVRTSNKSTNDIVGSYTINDSFAFYDLGGIRQVRLLMTAYTSGTANVTFEGTQMNIQELLNYSGTDNDVAPPLRHLSIASLSTDGTLHAIRNTNADPVGDEYALITRGLIYGVAASSFSPDPSSFLTGVQAQPLVDDAGNLEIRGQVLTDEGSFRDDFSGANLATNLAGTVTFTNGSAVVTGVGTVFTTALSTEKYIKVAAQSDAFYTRVLSVDSDTQVTLEVVYPGATAAATTGASTNWSINAVGTGAVTVVTSEALLAPGTGATGAIGIRHTGDYPPYTLLVAARITQRIANQTAFIGFQDNPAAPGSQCGVFFTGTNNTQVTFRTAYSAQASEIQDTVVTLPGGVTTAATNRYQIDLLPDGAVLSINGVVVATNSNHIPAPYVSLTVNANIANTAVVTATTLGIDYVFFSNQDVVQIDNVFSGAPVAMAASGTAANGAIVSANPVLIAGSDGTNVRTILTSVAGAVRIDPTGTTTQPISAAALPLPTGAATETTLAAINTKTPNQGQATMAASVPVVIASNQSNLPANITQIAGTAIVTGGVAGTQGIGGLAAAGAAKAGNPVLIAGQDGTNAQTLLTDTAGRLIVSTVDSPKLTYSAAIVGLTAAVLVPTDIFTITGAAGKVCRINRITLTGSQTTAAQRDVLIIKRSAANTAGTSTTLTNVPHDSNNAAGAATVRAYTVNPTGLGTAVGTMKSRKVFIATATTNSDEFILDFGTRNDQAVVLRSAAEVLAINLNSIASAGSSFDINIEWTEE